MSNIDRYDCYFDGSCLPENPGGSVGAGVVINKNNEPILELSLCFGKMNGKSSSNLAEYLAVQNTLISLIDMHVSNSLIYIYGDSRMVINQLNGVWKYDENKLYGPQVRITLDALRRVQERNEVHLVWIERRLNNRADELSKEAHINSC